MSVSATQPAQYEYSAGSSAGGRQRPARGNGAVMQKNVRIGSAAVLCTVWVFVCLLSSCSADVRSSGRRQAGAKKVALSFMSDWGGNDQRADMIQQILNDFCESNPDISVSNYSVFGDDYSTFLKTAFVSGNEPDVFSMAPGSDVGYMIAADKIAPLDELFSDDAAFKSSFEPSMWKYVTVNRKIYGVPVELSFQALFINRDLFEKYHVAVPETFGQLKTAVAVFRQNDVVPIAFNGTLQGSYLYQSIVAGIGGEEAVAQPVKNGKIDESYIEAMQFMKELYDMQAFPKEAFSLTSAERDRLFKEKKAAMLVQSAGYICQVNKDPCVDLIPFPACNADETGARKIVYGLGNGVFRISTKAWKTPEQKRAAERLIKFISSGYAANTMVRRSEMLTNVKVELNNFEYDAMVQTMLGYIRKARELVEPPDTYVSSSIWEDAAVRNLPYVLEGKISPENVWENALAS